MPTWATITIFAVIVGSDLMVFAAIRSIIFQMFRKWQEKYPPVEPMPGAVTRRFQSFSFGLINAGMSMHVTADESYLHLNPVRFVRWFGMMPLSIPWDAFGRVTKRGRMYTRVMLDTTTVVGPTWCMSLLDADVGDGADAELTKPAQ